MRENPRGRGNIRWYTTQCVCTQSRKQLHLHLYIHHLHHHISFSLLAINDNPSDIKIGEFHLDLVPFDVDVLSMEMPTSFRVCLTEREVGGLKAQIAHVAIGCWCAWRSLLTVLCRKGDHEATISLWHNPEYSRKGKDVSGEFICLLWRWIGVSHT